MNASMIFDGNDYDTKEGNVSTTENENMIENGIDERNENMTVRDINEATFEALGLPDAIVKHLDGVSARKIIHIVRGSGWKDQLTAIRGIGEKHADVIRDAVDAAGFIFHESKRSQAYRRLAYAVLKDRKQNNRAEVGDDFKMEEYRYAASLYEGRYEDRIAISEVNQSYCDQLLFLAILEGQAEWGAVHFPELWKAISLRDTGYHFTPKDFKARTLNDWMRAMKETISARLALGLEGETTKGLEQLAAQLGMPSLDSETQEDRLRLSRRASCAIHALSEYTSCLEWQAILWTPDAREALRDRDTELELESRRKRLDLECEEFEHKREHLRRLQLSREDCGDTDDRQLSELSRAFSGEGEEMSPEALLAMLFPD